MRVAGQSIRILVLFVAVLLVSASERPAFAAQYSAIVMDMRDGTVLYESNPDRRQSPASLTKMMTLYLAFEAVENDQVGQRRRRGPGRGRERVRESIRPANDLQGASVRHGQYDLS
jgi:D-alanyl-D-alanine carboxypeptidase